MLKKLNEGFYLLVFIIIVLILQFFILVKLAYARPEFYWNDYTKEKKTRVISIEHKRGVVLEDWYKMKVTKIIWKGQNGLIRFYLCKERLADTTLNCETTKVYEIKFDARINYWKKYGFGKLLIWDID